VPIKNRIAEIHNEIVASPSGDHRAAWNFGLTAGSFGPSAPERGLGLWRRFFSFRGRRRGRRQRPEFETPETSSKRREKEQEGELKAD